MKHVIIYTLTREAREVEAARCVLNEDRVICSGDKTLVENLEKHGIEIKNAHRTETLFPKDGLRFLEALRTSLNSGYIAASPVLE